MLTRGQVAKRLGKSVATVRRLEGRGLHPRRDSKGVLRFDPAEVEAVVEGKAGESSRSGWLEAELDGREREEPAVGADKLVMTAADFDERVRAAAAKLVRDELTHQDQERLRRESERAARERAEARAAGPAATERSAFDPPSIPERRIISLMFNATLAAFRDVGSLACSRGIVNGNCSRLGAPDSVYSS